MKKEVKEFVEFYGLDELIAQERSLELQPGEITIYGLAKQTGWSRSRAETVLKEWEAAGLVEPLGQRREPERGQRVKAWRLVQKEGNQ